MLGGKVPLHADRESPRFLSGGYLQQIRPSYPLWLSSRMSSDSWIEHVKAEAATRPAVRFSAMWIIFGAIVAAAFVLILGPGVRLSS